MYTMEVSRTDNGFIHSCGMGGYTRNYRSQGRYGKVKYDLPITVLAFLITKLLEYAELNQETKEGEECESFVFSILYGLGIDEAYLLLGQSIAIELGDILKEHYKDKLDEFGYWCVKEVDFPEVLSDIYGTVQSLYENGEDFR